MERLETINRWTKVSPGLFAVLSPDGLTLMVGWHAPNTALPVTCSVARVLKPMRAEEWVRYLVEGFRHTTMKRDPTCRAAAMAAVAKFGGTVFRYEDREPHLKVC